MVTLVSRLMIRASGASRSSSCECISPDVGWRDRTDNRSVRFFREGHVFARVANLGLLNPRRT